MSCGLCTAVCTHCESPCLYCDLMSVPCTVSNEWRWCSHVHVISQAQLLHCTLRVHIYAMYIPYGREYWWELHVHVYLADLSFSLTFEDWQILIWRVGELRSRRGRGQVLQLQRRYKVGEIPIGRIFGGFKFGRRPANLPNRQIKFPANISGCTV